MRNEERCWQWRCLWEVNDVIVSIIGLVLFWGSVYDVFLAKLKRGICEKGSKECKVVKEYP